MAKIYNLYINGKWIKSTSKEKFPSINPAKTKQILGYFPKGNEDDVNKAVESAENAFEKWSSMPPPKRGLIIMKAAQMLKNRKEELSKLVTMEMGKVLTEARGDVQEAIDTADYMAGEGRRMFGYTTPSELGDKFCMTIRRPVGIYGLITPWNFPMAIPAWKIFPALICGNTIVFKPSSDTPLCALRLVEILEKAGLPKGVLNFVTGSGSDVGMSIIEHEKIRGISFTGNKETGREIMREAGIKKIGLELGGKNGIIIMDDADLDLALDGVIWGGYGTTGQRCTAASRIIVHKKVKQKFEKMLVNGIKKLKIGNGLNPKVDVGPLINKTAQEKSKKYVEIGLSEGAKLLVGGKIPKMNGFFFEPTLFTDCSVDMRIAQEEIFGPIVSLITVNDFDEAIDVINSIEYGLSSSIYTSNIRNAFKAMEDIEAGITYINSSTIGAETHLPFGGVKQTGNGTREGGWTAIEEFSEVKTIYVDYSGKLQKAQIDIE